MKKRIISFVSAFCIFFMSLLSVSAESLETDFSNVFGIPQDVIQENMDEWGTFDFEYDFPSLIATDLYEVQEKITISGSGLTLNWDSSYSGSATLLFGQSKVITNLCTSASLVLNNNNEVLFSNAGTLNLLIVAYANNVYLNVYHSDGTGERITVTPNLSSTSGTAFVSIDNSFADITTVQIVYSGGVVQSTNDTWIACGVIKYGYILDESPSDSAQVETSKNIFEAIKTFFGNFWSNITSSLVSPLKVAIGYVTSAIDDIWSLFTDDWDASMFFINIRDTISDFLTSPLENITTRITNIFSQFTTGTSAFWGFITSRLVSPINAVINTVYSRLTSLFDEFTTATSSFWGFITSIIVTPINTLVTTVYNKLVSLFDEFTNGASVFWGFFDSKLEDIFRRFWTGKNPSSEEVQDDISRYDDEISGFYNSAMDTYDNSGFEYVDLSSNTAIASAMLFCSSFMEKMYYVSGEYSVLVNFTFTMIIASILLGIHRFWKK